LIKKLINPLTPRYAEAKKLVLGSDLSWYYQSGSTYDDFFRQNQESSIGDSKIIDVPYFSHSLLVRPKDNYVTKISSSYWEALFLPVIKEIIAANDLKVEMFARANINCAGPCMENVISEPHHDHKFYHNNLIIYFNDAGGSTVIINENDLSIIDTFEPTEDSIITFSGFHAMRPSKTKRRIVLVATYV
jgi:hypothetical protein